MNAEVERRLLAPISKEALPSLKGDGANEAAVRRDALENRERILASARALFAEWGADALTMKEVGEAAGVGPGTLYRHFENKGALALGLLSEINARLEYDVREALGGRLADAPALEQLSYFVERYAACIEDHAPLIGLVGTPSIEQPFSRFENSVYVWKQSMIVFLLERALLAGEVPDLDLEWWSHALAGALDEHLYMYQQHLGFSAERIVSALKQLVISLKRGED